MFIVVHHDITSKAFFEAGESVVKNVPAGVKPIHFLPSTDGKQAVCLWEAKTIDAVKNHLEPKIGKSARNTYYAVDSKIAMGLPVAATT